MDRFIALPVRHALPVSPLPPGGHQQGAVPLDTLAQLGHLITVGVYFLGSVMMPPLSLHLIVTGMLAAWIIWKCLTVTKYYMYLLLFHLKCKLHPILLIPVSQPKYIALDIRIEC